MDLAASLHRKPPQALSRSGLNASSSVSIAGLSTPHAAIKSTEPEDPYLALRQPKAQTLNLTPRSRKLLPHKP